MTPSSPTHKHSAVHPLIVITLLLYRACDSKAPQPPPPIRRQQSSFGDCLRTAIIARTPSTLWVGVELYIIIIHKNITNCFWLALRVVPNNENNTTTATEHRIGLNQSNAFDQLLRAGTRSSKESFQYASRALLGSFLFPSLWQWCALSSSLYDCCRRLETEDCHDHHL